MAPNPLFYVTVLATLCVKGLTSVWFARRVMLSSTGLQDSSGAADDVNGDRKRTLMES